MHIYESIFIITPTSSDDDTNAIIQKDAGRRSKAGR